MRLHMLFTIHGSLERFLTIGAHEGTHLTVGGHVPFQAAVRGESPITNQTFVGLEARMRPDV